MSDRRTQAAMLALVGVAASWLGLTDAALAYVRGALRPPLVASGVVLLVMAGGRAGPPGARAWRPRAGPRPRRPPQRLAAGPPGAGPAADGAPGGVFPPLAEPVGGAVPLPVSEFVTRALYDKDRTLAGARVRLLGLAAPGNGKGGGYLLTRFNLFCCAADGQAYQLEVRGDRAPRQLDQWLVVEGRWLPQRVYDGIAPSGVRPALLADSVTPVRPPADSYEHNLYGL